MECRVGVLFFNRWTIEFFIDRPFFLNWRNNGKNKVYLLAAHENATQTWGPNPVFGKQCCNRQRFQTGLWTRVHNDVRDMLGRLKRFRCIVHNYFVWNQNFGSLSLQPEHTTRRVINVSNLCSIH